LFRSYAAVGVQPVGHIAVAVVSGIVGFPASSAVDSGPEQQPTDTSRSLLGAAEVKAPDAFLIPGVGWARRGDPVPAIIHVTHGRGSNPRAAVPTHHTAAETTSQMVVAVLDPRRPRIAGVGLRGNQTVFTVPGVLPFLVVPGQIPIVVVHRLPGDSTGLDRLILVENVRSRGGRRRVRVIIRGSPARRGRRSGPRLEAVPKAVVGIIAVVRPE